MDPTDPHAGNEPASSAAAHAAADAEAAALTDAQEWTDAGTGRVIGEPAAGVPDVAAQEPGEVTEPASEVEPGALVAATVATEQTTPVVIAAGGERVVGVRPGANPRRALIGLAICTGVMALVTLIAGIMPRVSGPDAPAGWWPFVVLIVGVGSVITLITVVRMPAFLALVFAAIGAGLMARVGSLPPMAGDDPGKLAKVQPAHWKLAVDLTSFELGHMTTKIGLIIALAAVIGTYLLESGAADKVVRRCLALFGEKHAALAILVGTYVVSIPIFFDTIFMLLIPLAKALRLRTGKDYTLYMMAICCPALITHSMVIPHPGPIMMADYLHLEAGSTIIFGWLTGIIPLIVGWVVINLINRRTNVPLTETPGATLADLQAVMDRKEEELPSLAWSLAPVLLPVFLISLASFIVSPWSKAAYPSLGWLFAILEFLGDRHIALIISLVIAAAVLMRRRGTTLRELGALAAPSLELAAVMILITIAGGAFGLMLKNAHVADAIKEVVAGTSVNLIVLSWLVAAVIRIAQGSATVAMLVTSGMMVPLVVGQPLPYHSMYIFLAIGYGAMCCSWMNDGGFWVVGKLGGMTERETLRTWTVMTTSISIAGLGAALLLAWLIPMV
jgi:GntP family gluconate:H+ symporter